MTATNDGILCPYLDILYEQFGGCLFGQEKWEGDFRAPLCAAKMAVPDCGKSDGVRSRTKNEAFEVLDQADCFVIDVGSNAVSFELGAGPGQG